MDDLVDVPLFDLAPTAAVSSDPSEKAPVESYGRRLTRRHVETLAQGWHPIRPLLRLHPDAPPVDDRTAAGPRCGTCSHLGGYGYLKCLKSAWTHGPATDVRRWWPACTDYKEAG